MANQWHASSTFIQRPWLFICKAGMFSARRVDDVKWKPNVCVCVCVGTGLPQHHARFTWNCLWAVQVFVRCQTVSLCQDRAAVITARILLCDWLLPAAISQLQDQAGSQMIARWSATSSLSDGYEFTCNWRHPITTETKHHVILSYSVLSHFSGLLNLPSSVMDNSKLTVPSTYLFVRWSSDQSVRFCI